MKNYYRIMLGRKSIHAEECIAGNFIGADFDVHHNLTGHLPDEWRAFNREQIPIYLTIHPGKSRIAAGLACGFLWTIAKGVKVGDIALCPDGSGRYRLGEVTGEYIFQPDGVLPHRRPVRWLSQLIDRADMSEALRNSTGSIGTVSDVSKYRDEIETLIGPTAVPVAVSSVAATEDASAFAMESHLEDFLEENWAQTDFGKEYDIYTEDSEPVGRQYQTDTGPLDILAISKDKKRLLVVELKKGRAADAVVGQTLRYMGYVQEELAEPGQSVHGAIIALEDDTRIRRALSMVPTISFYRYQISFKLVKS